MISGGFNVISITFLNFLGFGLLNKFIIEFSSVFWEENKTMLAVTPEGEFMSGMMSGWLNLYPGSGQLKYNYLNISFH